MNEASSEDSSESSWRLISGAGARKETASTTSAVVNFPTLRNRLSRTQAPHLAIHG